MYIFCLFFTHLSIPLLIIQGPMSNPYPATCIKFQQATNLYTRVIIWFDIKSHCDVKYMGIINTSNIFCWVCGREIEKKPIGCMYQMCSTNPTAKISYENFSIEKKREPRRKGLCSRVCSQNQFSEFGNALYMKMYIAILPLRAFQYLRKFY